MPRRSPRSCAARGAAWPRAARPRGARTFYDPRTGESVGAALASVTVTGESLEVADVLATAAFVAGSGWADVLACEPGYAGLAVTIEGTVVPTSDWSGGVR